MPALLVALLAVPVLAGGAPSSSRMGPAAGKSPGKKSGDGAKKESTLAPLRDALSRLAGYHAGESGPRTGQDGIKAKLPIFNPEGEPIGMGETLNSDGLPLSLSTYDTKLPPQDVLALYAKHFEEKGWPWYGPMETRKVIPIPAVTATDPVDAVQLSVLAIPEKTGLTTVILGVADMLGFRENLLERAPEELPLFPGSAVSHLDVGGPEEGGSMVHVLAPAPRDEVLGFYRDESARRGWRFAAMAPSEQGLVQCELVTEKRRFILLVSGQGEKTLLTAVDMGGGP